MKHSVESLLAEMTLEEKAGLCSGYSWWHLKGVERLGLPSIMVTDGPHGLRKQETGQAIDQSLPATCFPTAAGLASNGLLLMRVDMEDFSQTKLGSVSDLVRKLKRIIYGEWEMINSWAF